MSLHPQRLTVRIQGVFTVGEPEPNWQIAIVPSRGWRLDGCDSPESQTAFWNLYSTLRQEDIFERPIVGITITPEYWVAPN